MAGDVTVSVPTGEVIARLLELGADFERQAAGLREGARECRSRAQDLADGIARQACPVAPRDRFVLGADAFQVTRVAALALSSTWRAGDPICWQVTAQRVTTAKRGNGWRFYGPEETFDESTWSDRALVVRAPANGKWRSSGRGRLFPGGSPAVTPHPAEAR